MNTTISRVINGCLFLKLIWCLPPEAPAQSTNRPPPAATLTELQQRITGHISQPRFAPATWGVKIVSLDTGTTLFEHNAGKLLKPASNAKLFTGALALDRLGPEYRIRTSFLSMAKPDRHGVLRSALIVYGRGDPSFAARFNDGDYAKSFKPLIEALKTAGVKRIKGDLIGDESYFRGPPFGSSWTWDDLQYYYGAEVSALTHEDNVVDLVVEPADKYLEPCIIITKPDTRFLTFVNRTLTLEDCAPKIAFYKAPGQNVVYLSGQLPLNGSNHVDAVAVHNPALWFVTRLKEALARRGVKVSGTLRTINWLNHTDSPPDAPYPAEIAFVESPPAREILTKMMKPSQNLYAQLLLLQVGAVIGEKELDLEEPIYNPGKKTTEDLGIAELHKFVGEIGISTNDVLLNEGSGLSRSALVTPNAIVELLKFMSRHRHADIFRAALPVAGVDGSLRNRMKGTTAERNLRAKTGSIDYVHTLSGYVTTAAGERLAFSIMLNACQSDSRTGARDDVDALAVMLAEFKGRSDRP
jgi:D-alanyl-D-alanine carboxypeptidase/D-alanyl-D-alanine-endopeptidase (penicillin-binding protein 4)